MTKYNLLYKIAAPVVGALMLTGCAGNIRRDTGSVYNFSQQGIERELTREDATRLINSNASIAYFMDKVENNNKEIGPNNRQSLEAIIPQVETEMKNRQYDDMGIGYAIDTAKYLVIIKSLSNNGSNRNNSSSSQSIGSGSPSRDISDVTSSASGSSITAPLRIIQ